MKNDFRDYICHSNDHKYVSKHKNRFGNWIYSYNKYVNQKRDIDKLKKDLKKQQKKILFNLKNQMIVDKGSQKVADDIAKSKGQKIDNRRRIRSLKDFLSEYITRSSNWLDANTKILDRKYGHANRFKQKYYADDDKSNTDFSKASAKISNMPSKERKRLNKFLLKEKQHTKNTWRV